MRRCRFARGQILHTGHDCRPGSTGRLFCRDVVAQLAFCLLVTAGWGSFAQAAELGMGFRIGEVTADSAVVWTRVTRDPHRAEGGFREPRKREPKSNEFVPPTVPVEDREGEMVGAVGEVRLKYGTQPDLADGTTTDWFRVEAEHDFVHQFEVSGLQPATRYYVQIEARDPGASGGTATVSGEFGTPATAKNWQDVEFAVITGQSYWDLDHPDGFNIYPAMRERDLDFVVPTGDTVYLDSEAPRARTPELARYHWHRMYSLPRHIELHRHVPGYWEVDDHDSWVNDCWPTMKANWMLPLTFDEGFAIYREQVPLGSKPTHRTIRWGKGLQIWLVEGRLYRSPNRMADGPEKTIWGHEQRKWLMDSIVASNADFKVLISPTPIVGPDRGAKADNHANDAFRYEGDLFRQWTAEAGLTNLFVCCGDRHWQYHSIDPQSRLHEFSCGPVSNKHAGGSPGRDPEMQPFHRVKGGFLTVAVDRHEGLPRITFRHHDVQGEVVNEFVPSALAEGSSGN